MILYENDSEETYYLTLTLDKLNIITYTHNMFMKVSKGSFYELSYSWQFSSLLLQ